GVQQDVVEQRIVADRIAGANDRLLLAKELGEPAAAHSWRIGDADTRGEVVVVTFLLDAGVEWHPEAAESRKRQHVRRRAVVLVPQAQCKSKVRHDLPAIVDEVGLLKAVRIDDRAAEDLRSEDALDAGELVDKVSERAKTAAAGEGQGAAVVERNEFLRQLPGQIDAGANGVGSHRVGDGVLVLEVIQDAALWKQGAEPESGDRGAAEGQRRPEVDRRLIARRKERLESAVA